MFNKVILIGRLGKNAEVKTAQNKKDYAVLSIATSESWKNVGVRLNAWLRFLRPKLQE